MFDGGLQAVGHEKLAERIGGFVDDSACFGERAVVERELGADGVVELAIGKPRKIVEVSGNARGFFDVEGNDQAVSAGLKTVADFGEKAALHELVGGGLEIVFAGLRAGLPATDGGYGGGLGEGGDSAED